MFHLYDAAVASLTNQASNYLMTGNIPKRLGNLHPNIAPYGELFKTKDGKMVTFAIGSNRHFRLLCELLQLPDLEKSEAYKTNQFRVKNRTQLAKLIAAALLNIDLQTLIDSCLANGIPCAEIKTIDQVLQNKLAHGLIKEEQIEGKKTSRITSIAAKWTN